jgi:predicted acyltransferase
VIFTAGLALVCLAVCYWVLDVKRWRGTWTKPFIVFGMNPIAAYVFAEIISHWIEHMYVHLANGRSLTWQEMIYQRVFAGLVSPPNLSLIYALVYVLICWVAMWMLYRKGIFLKI